MKVVEIHPTDGAPRERRRRLVRALRGTRPRLRIASALALAVALAGGLALAAIRLSVQATLLSSRVGCAVGIPQDPGYLDLAALCLD